jgi:hypothetical protein
MKCEDSELSFKFVCTASNAASATNDYGFNSIQTITLENSSGVIETVDYYNGVCTAHASFENQGDLTQFNLLY